MKAFTYNHLSRQKQLHSRCSGASEKKSLDSRVWEMAETKIQCNAFISRWNIAHFPKKSKEETKQGKGLNETVPKTHTHQHEICICYVKIINFKIGFIKMYEFGKVLCEWIVSVSGVYVCVCVLTLENRERLLVLKWDFRKSNLNINLGLLKSDKQSTNPIQL